MAERELIESYRQGRIGQVTFFRGLVKNGVSVGAAMSLVLATAPAAMAGAPVCPPANALIALTNAAAQKGDPDQARHLLSVAAKIAAKHPGCGEINVPPNLPPNTP